MTLSERVLQLHTGIRTVLVTRKVGEEWKVVDESIKAGVRLLEDTRTEARAMLQLSPVIILGTAENIGGKAGRPEIASVLYERVGAIFVPLDKASDGILCLTTERELFEEVIGVIRRALPDLKGSP